MASRMRIVFAAAALTLALGLQGGPQHNSRRRSKRRHNSRRQPIPRSRLSFRTGINFVRVDVIISDKAGNPIADLSQADFDVTEDGKPQKIETFKSVKLDGGRGDAIKSPPREIRTDYDEEMEAARDDVRLFAIFLDDYHVRKGASLASRNQLSRFIETQLGPSDMVGVMYPLESTASVRMTRNHSAVMRGLQQFEGRKYDYTPRNMYEEQYANYPTETVERIRNQVSLSALKSLIVHMGSLKEGRKSLDRRQRGLHLHGAAADAQRQRAAAGTREPERAQSDGRHQRHQRRPRGAGRSGWTWTATSARSTTPRTEQRRDLFRRPARARDVRVRHQRRRGPADRHEVSQLDDGLAADALGEHRRPGDRQPQRPRRRHEADHPRRQRLLPDRLQLVAGAVGRQVPRDQGAREAAGVQVRARKGYWALTQEQTARALAPPKAAPPKAVEVALAAVNRPGRASVVRTGSAPPAARTEDAGDVRVGAAAQAAGREAGLA
jgi:hypothetical protein